MMMMMFITISAETLKLEGETENMCVWTKKRGSMKVIRKLRYLWPKSLHNMMMMMMMMSAPNPICCGDSGGRAGSLTKPYKN